MSQNELTQNNPSNDDVTYVFYRGVRTAVRKPVLQPTNSPENEKVSGTAVKSPEAIPTISPQNFPLSAAPSSISTSSTAPSPIQIKKVSPSQAKPWLNDNVILPSTQGGNAQLPAKLESGNIGISRDVPSSRQTKNITNNTAQSNISSVAPVLCDELIPAVISMSDQNATAVAAEPELASRTPETVSSPTDGASRALQISLRQLPLLRPAIHLPPLFAAGEVVKGNIKDATTLMELAAEPLLLPRKGNPTPASEASIQQASTQEVSTQAAGSVSNEMLLREIEQLRAHMDEMKLMLQQMQAQLLQAQKPNSER